MPEPMKAMVLAGGPDRERQVSLASGQEVASGLRQSGHEVRLRDIGPDQLSALDEFEQWPGEALFLALHGPWGEGGGLQRILEQRHLPFFGCDAAAAVGKLLAERAKAAGVEQVAFDRSGFKYHGRVRALADAAREAGLQF